MPTPFEKLAGVTLEGEDLADLPEVVEQLKAFARVPVTAEPTELYQDISPTYEMSDDEFEAHLAHLARRKRRGKLTATEARRYRRRPA